jgi:hypothetical protein
VAGELRGSGANLPAGGEKIGLPTRVFLFTLDQISVMTNISEKTLESHHIYFQGRSIGSRKKSLMIAVNIAPPDEKPDWRVAEREFIRWMRVKGFRYYERGSFH